jgi:type IV secretory pathway TraG/TraD family ATPase VirD4
MLGNNNLTPSFTSHPGIVFVSQLWSHLPPAGKLFVALILVLLTVVAVGILMDSFKKPITERHISGVRLASWKKLAKITAHRDKSQRQRQIMLGQVPLPADHEYKHVLIVGTTGVGKSTLIRQILPRIRARGERAIVIDLNGEFSENFLTKDDRIFNPFDDRSLKWNPLAEVRSEKDIEPLLRAMIPTGPTLEDETWRGYARDFLRTLIRRLHEAGELRLDRLKYYVTAAGDKEVAAFLQAGKNPSRLQENSMVSTTKSVLKHFIESLDRASSEPDFSIRDWVLNGKGFIFITPMENEREALMLLNNTFMNLVVKEAQSAPKRKRNAGIALVIDELASFDFDDLINVLTKGRKFGLMAFAGIQNTAQLREKFGLEGATTLMACFLTKVIFNPGEAKTRDDMADEIGKRIVDRLEISSSKSADGRSTRTSTWHRMPSEHIVTPDDLGNLHSLSAYLKFSTEGYPAAKITVHH